MAPVALLVLALSAPVAAQEETTSRTTNGTQTVTKDKGASDNQEDWCKGASSRPKTWPRKPVRRLMSALPIRCKGPTRS
jgi:hypothetical protein